MKWTLIDIKQETNHPFLNYFTVTYDIEKEDGHHTYSYYLCSRRDKEHLLPKIKRYSRPDAVMIPLYYLDEKTGKVSVVLTRQFRPAMGTYVTSVPAGLLDDNDEDIFKAAMREAKEEVGADITDLEMLSPSAPTSSGLSDETNAVVLGRITGFENTHLEEFEDIGFKLVPLAKAKEMMEDKDVFMAVNVRLILLYLLLRFKDRM